MNPRSSHCVLFVFLVGCSGGHTAGPSAISGAGRAGNEPQTAGTDAAPVGSTSAPDAAVPAAGTGTASAQAGTHAGTTAIAGQGGGAGAAGSSNAGHAAESGSGGGAGTGAGGQLAGAGSSAQVPTGAGPAETRALGYGQATTGGGDKAPAEAATLAALQAAIDAYSGTGGLVLRYTGKFNFASISDPCTQHTLPAQLLQIKQKNDLTILGADGSAANFGIHVAGSSSNIIIRNLTFGLLPGGGDSDAISLEGMSSGFPNNIWIDHNELSSSLADCPGAGDTAFDGLIDLKKGADHVTISYNYLHDHQKASLHGYSDDDDAARHVTIHHNLFEKIGSRTPLQRHGYAHVLNNAFVGISTSGINVRMEGYALIEANYFENVLNPVTSRDSAAIGYWDLRDNNLASAADVAPGNSFGITWDMGNSGTVNATDWTTTKAFPDALGYTYTADSFACVRDGLRAVVGPGKGLATLACR
ncbi:MAG TPA: polysaccharide lyase family 1 protein [Polyangiales bacterium]|nr:polysaccharide lyase family 1 protein [Polyangiales bacterium]